MRQLTLAMVAISIFLTFPTKATSHHKEWGSIGNESHHGQKIAATIYFPGIPREGAAVYGSKDHYTAFPLEFEEGFDEDDIKLQLRRMKSIGINVVLPTYWGHDSFYGSDGLPMDATDGHPDGNVLAAYTRLIRIIEQEGLLFSPHIDVNYFFEFINFFFKLYYGFDLDISILNAYCFLTQFPDYTENLQDRISWWVENFGDSESWLEVYNNAGQKKKVISLIETIMPDYPFLDWLPFDPFVYDAQAFSDGFIKIADKIAKDYGGFQIGFSIDPTPIGASWLYGDFKPRPEDLMNNKTILYTMFWDVTNDGTTNEEKMAIATSYFEKWQDFPAVVFLMSGWKGDIVFPWTIPYGMTKQWRELQKTLIKYATAGISLGSWNGWTEWFHVTCSQQHGSMNLKWGYECIQYMDGNYSSNSSHITCPND